MTSPEPRIQWKQGFRLDRFIAIAFTAFLVAGVAGGLWVGYRTGGWMWLVAPAAAVLWVFLVLLGLAFSFHILAARHSGTSSVVLSLLALLTWFGLLGYFAYWALSAV